MPGIARPLSGVLASLLLICLATPAPAAGADRAAIGERHVSFTDTARTVKAENGYAGSPVRRIDVTVWYPVDPKASATDAAAPPQHGRHPLVIYSHGAGGQSRDGLYLARFLVQAGYVVAAPDYPLSSRAAYTKAKGADPGEVRSQVNDIRFIIDQLLASEDLAPTIDADRIGTIGHSLGAVTGYFASFGAGSRDPRIKAAVLLGAGDPVAAALAVDMGMAGTWTALVSVPVLFVSGDHDAIAGMTGRAYAAFSRVNPPKYEVMIKGGVHMWFAAGAPEPADGSNPDCAMFAGSPVTMPGCEKGAKLIGRAREQELTGTAVLDFLDGYLASKADRLTRLRNLPKSTAEVTERFEE